LKFQQYLDSIPGLIQWPLQELSGSIAAARVSGVPDTDFDGTITGATVGQEFGGHIPYAYLFDGINDFVNIYSTALNGVFDGAENTVILFAKIPSAEVWADAGPRDFFSLNVPGGEDFVIVRKTTDNISMLREGNNVRETVNHPTTTLSPFMIAMTVSESAGVDGEMKAYFNGVQSGATQTSLGAYAGALSTTQCVIGAFDTTPQLLTSGQISTVILHPTRAMTAAEISQIYQWSGI
jgi:hypothetical protein